MGRFKFAMVHLPDSFIFQLANYRDTSCYFFYYPDIPSQPNPCRMTPSTLPEYRKFDLPVLIVLAVE